jgi:polar amino acid transport system substrate-binding protein
MTELFIDRRRMLTMLAGGAVAAGSVATPQRACAAMPSAWDQIATSGTIRVGLIPNRTPYQWVVDGKVKGFIDTMARDFADKLGKAMGKAIQLQYVQTTNQTTVLDLQANRIDVFIPLTITPERKAALDMFEPLYLMPVVAFNRRGFTAGSRWEDYDKPGTRIAVVMGTTDELAARKRLSQATISSMKSTAEAVLEVISGKSDAVVMGLLLGLIGMKNNTNLGDITLLQPVEAPPSGGGVRKDGDGRLVRFLQDWATAYHDAGGATRAIMDAMTEAQLDSGKIPAGTVF